ncbi:cell division protein ZapE [Candidatus Pelagibacter sp.]|uniref:cell division protein ZapE n=1 Tax=Candidatus Pelagibacter sp. TaxID=2024849 RepID=UPI003F86D12F
MSLNLEKKFKTHCNTQNLELNPNQIILVKQLDNFYKENFKSSLLKFFSKQSSKKGFYLYGGVGVGKTMILDFFFNLVNQKKQRLHFNEFMLNFHDFVHDNKDKNEENVINVFVKDLKSKFSLIFFDEFQVTNIVDAMILGKLFQEIFYKNIKVIVTSNTKISELYKDGLQRDQFKPFIQIMQDKSIEHELIIDDDYRKSKENEKRRYFHPLNQETNFKINKFSRIITKNKKLSSKVLNIKGRSLEIKNFYDGISKFDFDELCNQNLGGEDYLKIAESSEFIIIKNVPGFNDINSNQQQRFITLIDVIYDKDRAIAVTAEQSLEKLSSSKSLEKPFKRTISRLFELTSKDF